MWHVKISWYEKLHQAQLQTQNTPEIPLSAQIKQITSLKTPSTTNMYNSAAWGVPPGCPYLQHPAATWGWSWESNNQTWSKLAKQHASTCRKPESYVLLSWDCGMNLESSKNVTGWSVQAQRLTDLLAMLIWVHLEWNPPNTRHAGHGFISLSLPIKPLQKNEPLQWCRDVVDPTLLPRVGPTAASLLDRLRMEKCLT